MTAKGQIRSIVVVGTGIVGLAAAIALRRALPGADITLVQLPEQGDGWIDRLGAATPSIHRFHRQIGLDPRVFVQRALAEPVRLRRYRRRDGAIVREASTAAIPFVEGVPIHHIWLRHQAAAVSHGPDLAGVMLGLREANGEDGGFGARFDPAAYRGLLADMVAALNILCHPCDDICVETADGAIASLVTGGGATLSADLYVDAAGPRSRLLTALGVDWHDWSQWLPSMQLSVSTGGGGTIGVESLEWSDGAIDWHCRRWRARLAGDAAAVAPGCLADVWCANAVAIGEAAARAPVLDGAGLGLALEEIMRLVGLLPRPGGGDGDRAEYRRRSVIAHDALRDWSSLSLADESLPPPPTLADMLAAFSARGRVAVPELDPIRPGEWLARLMALGPVPGRVDPTAMALPASIVDSTMARAV